MTTSDHSLTTIVSSLLDRRTQIFFVGKTGIVDKFMYDLHRDFAGRLPFIHTLRYDLCFCMMFFRGYLISCQSSWLTFSSEQLYSSSVQSSSWSGTLDRHRSRRDLRERAVNPVMDRFRPGTACAVSRCRSAVISLFSLSFMTVSREYWQCA